MGALAIREKLQAYIKTADDKKVKAIYTMVESDMANYEWWKDEKLIAAFDKDYENFISGKEKAYTLDDVKKQLKTSRKKIK